MLSTTRTHASLLRGPTWLQSTFVDEQAAGRSCSGGDNPSTASNTNPNTSSGGMTEADYWSSPAPSIATQYVDTYGGQVTDVDFVRNNGEYVTTTNEPVPAGTLRVDNSAPAIPQGLLPQGVSSSSVYGVRDQAGNLYYAVDGSNTIYEAALFTGAAQNILSQGQQGLHTGAITPSQCLDASRFVDAFGGNLPPASQPAQAEQTPFRVEVVLNPPVTEVANQGAAAGVGQGQPVAYPGTGGAVNPTTSTIPTAPANNRWGPLTAEFEQNGITPIAFANEFVGPLTLQQQEVASVTGLVLNQNDAQSVVSAMDAWSDLWSGGEPSGNASGNNNGVALAGTGVLPGSLPLGLTLPQLPAILRAIATGAQAVAVTTAEAISAAPAAFVLLLTTPGNFGSTDEVISLGDDRRFVIGHDMVTGRIEELDINGNWVTQQAGVRFDVLTPEQMAALNRPSRRPITHNPTHL